MESTFIMATKRNQKTYEEERQEHLDAAKLNQHFFMVFKKAGSPLLRDLIDKSPSACSLFLFLAEQADRTNAIVASGKALAAALNMSEATISRAIKVLIEKELIERLNSGGTNVFVFEPRCCLVGMENRKNPLFVWKRKGFG